MQDPFEILGHDVTVIVVSCLPAGTTESLRRVSRQWKHASEGNNKDAAIERLGWGGEGKRKSVELESGSGIEEIGSSFAQTDVGGVVGGMVCGVLRGEEVVGCGGLFERVVTVWLLFFFVACSV